MGPQDTSILHQQYHHFSGPSSDVDFEAAEQLLQHSRKGRDSNGEAMVGPPLESETSIEFSGSTGDQVLGERPLDNGYENGEHRLQDRHAESQYAPMHNQPPMGQVCRYTQHFALRVCDHNLQ